MTWPTSCFIGEDNIGCGAPTFAHTNGDGDFVLFDRLGSPWPIHQCYRNRESLLSGGKRWTSYFDIDPPKPKKSWKSASDIQRVDPATFSSRSIFHVVGYLQDHHLKRRDQLFKTVGNLGKKAILRVLEMYPDQLTVIVGDPDAGLQSFTAFGKLRKPGLQKKGMIAATLRSVSVMIPKYGTRVFVADDITVLPW